MKKRILIAEDDEPVRKMLGRVLESSDYSVLTASTGPEAVAGFSAARPDLVLLDLGAPDQAGWENLLQIREIEPLVPVVAITAWPEQYEQAVQRGIDALMEKPLDLPLLMDTIRGLLERHRRRSHPPSLERESPCAQAARDGRSSDPGR